MSRAHLLDVNVLIAIFDAAHQHNAPAHAWLAAHQNDAWATCSITENGFVRLASTLSNVRITPSRAAADLRSFQRQSSHHEFWDCAISITDPDIFDLGQLPSGHHATDAYLAALAHVKGGRLVTFDRALAWQAVRGATRDLIEVLRP